MEFQSRQISSLTDRRLSSHATMSASDLAMLSCGVPMLFPPSPEDMMMVEVVASRCQDLVDDIRANSSLSADDRAPGQLATLTVVSSTTLPSYEEAASVRTPDSPPKYSDIVATSEVLACNNADVLSDEHIDSRESPPRYDNINTRESHP